MACVALSLGGCSGKTGDYSPEPESSAQSDDALTWQEGSGGTRAYLGADEVVRCWNLQTKFDCLHAEIFDIRERIADAPVQRSYYRFLVSHLPARKSQFDSLATSDGYECSVSDLQDRAKMVESVWKNGRIVAQSPKGGPEAAAAGWGPQEILDEFKKHSISPRRPYFSCSMVDEIVTKMGLESLDSPLVTYEALVQADRLAQASEAGDGID